MLAKIQGGDYDHFGIMVDADYFGINGGFVARRLEIEGKLILAGYTRVAPANPPPFGDVYVHPTHIPIHLAILPDHANDGMAEHMLAAAVSAGVQTNLFVYVQACIAGLPNVLFNPALHMRKAEIATLLAWQDSPGCDSGIGVKCDVFDVGNPAFLPVVNWFKIVFP